MSVNEDFQRLQTRTEAELQNLLNNAQTHAEIDAAQAGLQRLHELRRQAILAEFNKATVTLVQHTELLQGVIDAIQVESPATPALRTFNDLVSTASAIHATIREPERLASATAADDITITLPVRDEEEAPPATTAAPVPADVGEARLPPIDSTEYPQLQAEYVAYFQAADVRQQWRGDLSFYVSRLNMHRPQYEAVGNALNIPWYFIGCIHALESSFDFETHLFNGDPLTDRTVHVPRGQPEAPPADGVAYSWDESATAAMRFEGFDLNTDWSLPRLLYRWERYNGMGYRSRGVPTPYLWSFSTLYESGRFVADHQFRPDAVSKQAGAATMLKELVRNGSVVLPA